MPALLVGQLRAAVQAVPDTLLGIRNRSIALMQFALTAGEHEVAYLRLRHIVEVEHGLEVEVRVSKTKPREVKVPFGSRPSTCRCTTAGTRSWTGAWTQRPSATSSPSEAGGPTSPSDTPDTRPAAAPPSPPAAPATTAASSPSRGGWVPDRAVMEGYFEDGDGWEENAMVGVL
ncbi:hypothetical protein ACWDSD_43035 [Streptomyces spiralis]